MINEKFTFEYAITTAICVAVLLVLMNIAFLIFRPHLRKILSKLMTLVRKLPGKIKSLAAIIKLRKTKAQSEDAPVLNTLDLPIVNIAPTYSSKLAYARYLPRIFLLTLNVFGIAFLILLLKSMIHSPGLIWKYPGDDQTLRSYEEPFVAVFDRPINTEVFKPYIFPEIKGEWKVEPVYDWFPWSKRKLIFTPYESMFPGKVFVYYADITDVMDIIPRWEFGTDAQSVPIPQLAELLPNDQTVDYAIDGNVVVKLDIPASRSAEWRLEIEPAVDYEVEYVDSQTIEMNFVNNLAQNTDYSFRLFRTPIRYDIRTFETLEKGEEELVKEVKFATVKEPLIESITPGGPGVKTDQNIEITFDNEMERDQVEAAFNIEPAVDYDFKWVDDRTLIVDPKQALQKETTYTITIDKGVRSKKGGFTQNQIGHTFETIGAVRVNSFTPAGGSVARGSNIVVYFNQEVDHASAQSKFSISPAVDGSFSWTGTALVFNPNVDLSYSTGYTVNIAAGVKTVYGIDSRQAFSHSFTVEPEVFVLNVPVYHQTLRYECNLLAARMALAYRGVYMTTAQAHSQIAKDNTPWDPNNNTWGNPHVGYVGDIYGVNKGYGVYWGPLSGFIGIYRSNSVRTGWNRTAALEEVRNGNPVIIWAHNGYSGSGQNISWTTPGGTAVYAISGMHSYVIVGWTGPIDNPTHIHLNDSNRGRWVISTSYFNSLWSFFNNSAVVVY